MKEHQKFNIKSIDELKKRIADLNLNINVCEDLSIIKQKVKVGTKVAPNGFAVLPMEGCDSNPDGSPSELVKRRYMRFACGGAGLLWWEACAITHEARANSLQMMLTEDNKDSFKELLNECMNESEKRNGYKPVNILQLTHSGRYARPNGNKAEPMIPQHDPILDARVGIDESYPIVTDQYLDSLPEKYVKSAILAKEVGFDGVDIKSCHRYLFSELLASYQREGKYGGSFENRTRLLRDTVRAVKKAVGDDFIVACRFNVFDAHPYPYGFGCDKDDMWKFDETEPKMLVQMLVNEGVELLSNSAGNPYYIYPQVTRPFDTSSMGIPVPQESQLESIERLFMFTRTVQKAAGNIPVVGNGYSWLRQFIPYVGAANLKQGSCKFIGLGRSSFAYPEAPHDVLFGNGMTPNKCCISCSKCTQIMRDHGRTGCVIRDSEIYLPLFKQAREEAEEREKEGK